MRKALKYRKKPNLTLNKIHNPSLSVFLSVNLPMLFHIGRGHTET